MNQEASTVNVYFTKTGEMKKIGWKTFEGMVYQLRLINDRYLKNNLCGDFTIRLPIKSSI